MLRTDDPYFDWLCRKVRIAPNRMGYLKLAYTLHHDFVFRCGRIMMDKNRATDGLQLRVDFMTEYGPLGSSENRGPCTMLEFLIGLARRMSFLMGSEENPHRTAHYFWAMIENLGIRRLTDDQWDYCHGDFRVEDAVNRVLDRTYERNGRGGLFPLDILRPDDDAREMEIWYQMQLWLNEHSEISLDL